MFSYVVLALYKTITLQNMKTLKSEVSEKHTYEIKQSSPFFITQVDLVITIPFSINILTIIITKDLHIIYLTQCYFSILQIRKQKLKKYFSNLTAISTVHF